MERALSVSPGHLCVAQLLQMESHQVNTVIKLSVRCIIETAMTLL